MIFARRAPTGAEIKEAEALQKLRLIREQVQGAKQYDRRLSKFGDPPGAVDYDYLWVRISEISRILDEAP